MSAPATSKGANEQNAPPAATAPAPASYSNHPNQSRKKSKKSKGVDQSTPMTSKLRSAYPLSNDSDTSRIQARLVSGGTAADLAEEGYRLCRINADLRRELDAAKAELRALSTTDNDAARIKARFDGNATSKEMADEAYRMCRINAHVKKDKKRMQAELREFKKEMAVKDDALNEMRQEYPEMRQILLRTIGLLKTRNIHVPEDLSTAFEVIVVVERQGWRDARKLEVKRNLPKPSKAVVKDVEERNKEAKKTPFLLHMQNGKVYDLEKPLASQDSDGEEFESESEPGLPVVSKKRKGDEMEMSVAKKTKVEIELEDGEVQE